MFKNCPIFEVLVQVSTLKAQGQEPRIALLIFPRHAKKKKKKTLGEILGMLIDKLTTGRDHVTKYSIL